MTTLAESQKQSIKKYFKEAFNRELSATEIEEIKLSLFFLARAIHRYQLIQNKKRAVDK